MKTKSLSILMTAASLMAVTAHASSLLVDEAKSRIQVDARATGHAFTGTLADYDVTVTGDSGTLDPTSFKLEWKFKDLKTADEGRDEEMIKWLNEADPEGSFVFVKSWTGRDGGKHAMGKLTIHGVAREISFPYTVSKDDDWVTIDGVAVLNYTSFNLPVIRSMALLTVNPELKVRFHIVGKIQ